ncbi:hypothetical protein N6P31_09360 [Pectobacterium betavasculorum]|uniref:hypothetical protein n=1 Tax=Pectobacterium betavasculorum TaxID=55207 RepID=UPI00313E0540
MDKSSLKDSRVATATRIEIVTASYTLPEAVALNRDLTERLDWFECADGSDIGVLKVMDISELGTQRVVA